MLTKPRAGTKSNNKQTELEKSERERDVDKLAAS